MSNRNIHISTASSVHVDRCPECGVPNRTNQLCPGCKREAANQLKNISVKANR